MENKGVGHVTYTLITIYTEQDKDFKKFFGT